MTRKNFTPTSVRSEWDDEAPRHSNGAAGTSFGAGNQGGGGSRDQDVCYKISYDIISGSDVYPVFVPPHYILYRALPIPRTPAPILRELRRRRTGASHASPERYIHRVLPPVQRRGGYAWITRALGEEKTDGLAVSRLHQHPPTPRRRAHRDSVSCASCAGIDSTLNAPYCTALDVPRPRGAPKFMRASLVPRPSELHRRVSPHSGTAHRLVGVGTESFSCFVGISTFIIGGAIEGKLECLCSGRGRWSFRRVGDVRHSADSTPQFMVMN
ncbi:hypothetical protein DFH07DRAFT_955470 [Mycena maculata]|uniref:Uncharacterized protein n=1 Tax=Mycena maculata TaxID=230809 RepID=A0AAD7NM95_9AGAR|nr:hypothetical protein DFH07DRAFT_955470 [Mycena maculata]